MAIARTGSIIEIDTLSLGAGTSGSTSVTAPTADLMVVAVSGYIATASSFSGHPPTYNGVAMTAVAAADANTADYNGAMFYMISPPSGAHTLAWNWVNAPPGGANDAVITVSFYTGTDLTTPIRDSDGKQAGAGTATSKTLTMVSGDLAVAWCSAFESASTTNTFTWTNATAVQGFPAGGAANKATAPSNNNSTLDLAEASPTGNGTITVSWSRAADGALMVIVLKAATQTLAVGKVSSSAAVRGANLSIAGGTQTLTVGKIASVATVRGVHVNHQMRVAPSSTGTLSPASSGTGTLSPVTAGTGTLIPDPGMG